MLQTIDNKIFIGKFSVEELAEKFGTPLYVYDSERIVEQINKFKAAFTGLPLKMKYAMKACNNINILKLVRKNGCGLDTVSPSEVETALKIGFQPSEIVFTPNLVNFSEIEFAVEKNVAINIENLSNLEKFGKKYGNSVPCCLRLNPNIITEVETAEVADITRFNVNKEHYGEIDKNRIGAWHNQSKFGISLRLFDELLKIIDTYNINVNGLHIHASHVILNKDVFVKGASIIFSLAKNFPNLKYFDFGGGIMVKHKPEDIVININEAANGLRTEYNKFFGEATHKPELWFEPGRYIVSEAGFLITNVDVLKSNGSVDFAGVDTGFNHLIRPMMYNAFHEIINASNPLGEKKKYSVVGNLCEVDNLGADRMLAKTSENDKLVILNAGAYGFSMSSQYNNRYRPAEVLLTSEGAKLIRKRETTEDFLRNQIEIEL